MGHNIINVHTFVNDGISSSTEILSAGGIHLSSRLMFRVLKSRVCMYSLSVTHLTGLNGSLLTYNTENMLNHQENVHCGVTRDM
jgi:hypothetical protein